MRAPARLLHEPLLLDVRRAEVPVEIEAAFACAQEDGEGAWKSKIAVFVSAGPFSRTMQSGGEARARHEAGVAACAPIATQRGCAANRSSSGSVSGPQLFASWGCTPA